MKLGIDMTSIYCEPKPYWDGQVLELFDKYGAKFFKRERIWQISWQKIANLHNKKQPQKYKDPRGWLYKKIQTYLWLSQPKSKRKHIQLLDKLLKIILRF